MDANNTRQFEIVRLWAKGEIMTCLSPAHRWQLKKLLSEFDNRQTQIETLSADKDQFWKQYVQRTAECKILQESVDKIQNRLKNLLMFLFKIQQADLALKAKTLATEAVEVDLELAK